MPKPRKCPRCGLPPAFYTEIWANHSIQFQALADGLPAEEGYLSEGNPAHVLADCPKGHSWRLRGVQQITDLRDLPQRGRGG